MTEAKKSTPAGPKKPASDVVGPEDAFVTGEIAKWRKVYPVITPRTPCSSCRRPLGKQPMICPCRKAYFCLACRQKRTKQHLLCKSEKMPAIIVTPPLVDMPPPHVGELCLGPELGGVCVPVRLIAHQYLPRMEKRGTAYYLANGVVVLQVADDKTPAVVQLPKSATYLADQERWLTQTEATLRRTGTARELILQDLTKADQGQIYGSVPANVVGIWNYDAYCEKRQFAVCLRGPEYRQVLPIFHPRGEEDRKAFLEYAELQKKFAADRGIHLLELSTDEKHPGKVVLAELAAHLARLQKAEEGKGESKEEAGVGKEEAEETEAKEGEGEKEKGKEETDATPDEGTMPEDDMEGYEEGAADDEDDALLDVKPDPVLQAFAQKHVAAHGS